MSQPLERRLDLLNANLARLIQVMAAVAVVDHPRDASAYDRARDILEGEVSRAHPIDSAPK